MPRLLPPWSPRTHFAFFPFACPSSTTTATTPTTKSMGLPSLSSSTASLKQAADRHFRSTAPSSLDAKYWTPPQRPRALSVATECKLMDQIDESVEFVLDCLGPNASIVTNWKIKANRNGMAFYEDHTLQEHKQSSSSQTRYCCVAQSIASVEDLMTIFVASDNETLKKNARIMHTKVVDTRLIALLKPATCDNPYTSTYVKYTRVSSGMWRRDRDLCAVVATNCMELADGSTMGYCLWDSVELPDECPDLTFAQGIQRTRMVRSGYILRNSGLPNAKTRILYFTGLNNDDSESDGDGAGDCSRASSRRMSVSQHVSSSTSFHALDQIGGNLERICAHFRRKPLNVNHFAAKKDWSSLSQAKYCCSCHHTFGLLSRRFNCTSCGDVMCRTCCCKEEVDLPGVGHTNMRICEICVRGMDESYRLSRASTNLRSTATYGRNTGTSSSSRRPGGGGGGGGCGIGINTIGGSSINGSGSASPTDSEEFEFRCVRNTPSQAARW